MFKTAVAAFYYFFFLSHKKLLHKELLERPTLFLLPFAVFSSTTLIRESCMSFPTKRSPLLGAQAERGVQVMLQEHLSALNSKSNIFQELNHTSLFFHQTLERCTLAFFEEQFAKQISSKCTPRERLANPKPFKPTALFLYAFQPQQELQCSCRSRSLPHSPPKHKHHLCPSQALLSQRAESSLHWECAGGGIKLWKIPCKVRPLWNPKI